MNKNLVKYMQETFSYQLENVKTCVPVFAKNKWIRPLQYLFLAVTVVMLLEFFDVINIGMNFVIYFLAIVFLIIFPLASVKENKKELLFITPEYFIKRLSKKDFVAVRFEDITSFSLDDMGIVFGDEESMIDLSMSMFKECLEVVIDILEAFGKTFDKKKDFMKRPVEIIIDGEQVKIKDLKVETPRIEKVAEKLMSKYDMLTPGFINEIIPKNAIIEKAYIKDNDLYFEMSHLEVNPGHPENVSFEAIMVEDCVFVFEAASINTLAKRDTNARTDTYKDVDADFDYLNKEIIKGVISEWKYNKGSIDLFFAVGVSTLKTNFDYKEILIGWNKQK